MDDFFYCFLLINGKMFGKSEIMSSFFCKDAAMRFHCSNWIVQEAKTLNKKKNCKHEKALDFVYDFLH